LRAAEALAEKLELPASGREEDVAAVSTLELVGAIAGANLRRRGRVGHDREIVHPTTDGVVIAVEDRAARFLGLVSHRVLRSGALESFLKLAGALLFSCLSCLGCLLLLFLFHDFRKQAVSVRLRETEHSERLCVDGRNISEVILAKLAVEVLQHRPLQRSYRIERPVGELRAQLGHRCGSRHRTFGNKDKLVEHGGLPLELDSRFLKQFRGCGVVRQPEYRDGGA